VVFVERRQVRFARDRCHLSSFEIRSGAATSGRSSHAEAPPGRPGRSLRRAACPRQESNLRTRF